MSGAKVRASVVIVGHVDHGKSTFIGRLLHDTDNLNPDRLNEVQKTSAELGRKLEYAYLMDQFREEREANITMDTTQVLLKIDGQPLLLIDAPGHKEYLKNMITGATQAHHAILMLDVKEGIREQTDKHARILKLLGLHHVAVLINKMDLVEYDEKVFRENKTVIEDLFKRQGLSAPVIIPISAYNGENLAARSEKMKWYDGPLALDFLRECAASQSFPNGAKLRFPIQLVINHEGSPALMGRVEEGELKLGQYMRVFPSGKRVRIHKIIKYGQSNIKIAETGDCVALRLEEGTEFKRGDILYSDQEPIGATRRFEADIFWASETPLRSGDEMMLECRTQTGRCKVRAMTDGMDDTSHTELSNGDVGRVQLENLDPVFLEMGEVALSRFVLQKAGNVIGCGVVSKVIGLLILVIMTGASKSEAYVDPGTGITFVSGLGAFLWGFLTLAIGTILLTFKKWKAILKNLFQSKKP